jgi:hypothetical protein
MRYLIDTMTLESCMMIFAGFLYNICVFACLLRPHINYPIKKRVQKKKDLKIYKSENSVDQQSITPLDAGDLIHKCCIKIQQISSYNSPRSWYQSNTALNMVTPLLQSLPRL